MTEKTVKLRHVIDENPRTNEEKREKLLTKLKQVL